MVYYGPKMKYAEPEPTEEVETLEKRFEMPKINLTVVQIMMIAITIAYYFLVRKVNGAVIASSLLFISLLHIYDHLYRVKRGPEELFFLPKKEGYCGMCKK